MVQKMLEFIITFLILQVVYVVLNTITSILKIKGGKMIASLSSAICYAFYVYVLIATATDTNPHIKAILVAITNFVGVYVSMWLLEKFKKDKLWEIKATMKDNNDNLIAITKVFEDNHISFNVLRTWDNKELILNIYSKSQKESAMVKEELDKVNAKYIVHEQQVKL
jgi:uncharacterized protein YebE (UPF0316 family)